ncbi:IS5 family transposase [Methylotuvimicrobium buryatense]|uniref:IS5 family transposase n=1 Tax=Methylotuvimicrobium buryatense TaxID=95641 RepID=UPI000344E541|nr:IS5 family transposase [Methylotuvimicrobium buryatense]
MNRAILSDGEWDRILVYLRQLPNLYIGEAETCRRFLDACLWVLRSGAQWRLVPTAYGKWNSIFKRFSRWCANGSWEKSLGFVSEEADLQEISLDGSNIRAHACAAGAKNSSAAAEALGRSKGGFGTKIHALCDGLGLPIKFALTGGQEAECKQAIPLLENVGASAVLADNAYDTNELREWLKK